MRCQCHWLNERSIQPSTAHYCILHCQYFPIMDFSVVYKGNNKEVSSSLQFTCFSQPRLIGNTCLYIHFCNSVIMYLAARFAAVSKWNVQRVALKHTFNTWPWHVFIRLVHARIAVFSLYCLRYVLPPFIIQISGECR